MVAARFCNIDEILFVFLLKGCISFYLYNISSFQQFSMISDKPTWHVRKAVTALWGHLLLTEIILALESSTDRIPTYPDGQNSRNFLFFSKFSESLRDYPALSLLTSLTVGFPIYQPLSMCTSRIFLSRTIFRPWHVLHRSFGLIRSPCPWQSWQTDWICCTIPGASCWIRTCIPVPRQLPHDSTAPFLPPRPTVRTK